MTYTLRCGEASELMAKELEDESVDLLVLDPAYGIDYKHANGASAHSKNKSTTIIKWKPIEGDTEVNGDWLAGAYRVLKNGGAMYICTRWDVEPKWRELIVSNGFILKQRLTWHKRTHGKGDLKGTWATSCEDVLFATKGRHILNSRPSMLLDVGCVPTWEHRYHPHQKPTALSDLIIKTSSKEGDTVLDLFMGSGSTGVSCANLNRDFVGYDISQEYVDLARERIEFALAKQKESQ